MHTHTKKNTLNEYTLQSNQTNFPIENQIFITCIKFCHVKYAIEICFFAFPNICDVNIKM